MKYMMNNIHLLILNKYRLDQLLLSSRASVSIEACSQEFNTPFDTSATQKLPAYTKSYGEHAGGADKT